MHIGAFFIVGFIPLLFNNISGTGESSLRVRFYAWNEPTTEVDEKWTVIWMHGNNNQSKRRLLIRLSKLI
jgi:hypothetical protein